MKFDTELGQFIVSEDCPRCGKHFSCGHAKHLKSCKPFKALSSSNKRRGAFVVGSDDTDGPSIFRVTITITVIFPKLALKKAVNERRRIPRLTNCETGQARQGKA